MVAFRAGARVGSTPPVPRYQFEFGFYRDGEPEPHVFQALAQVDIGGFSHAIATSRRDDDDMGAVGALFRLIAKSLDNRDGQVNATWKAVKLPLPDDTEEGAEPNFRGPDGKIYPWSERDTWDNRELWTSRRRWEHLAFQDDEVMVKASDLQDLMKRMVEQATDRPTQPSA